MQSTQSTNQTSSGQHVIKPNRAPGSRNHQVTVVEISSRDRNYMQRVPSNPVRFQFARPLKDVRSVELVSGTIPANPYNLIAGANQFTLTETAAGSTVSQTISLTPGYYTQATFLTHLNTVFTGLTTMNSYTWSYSSTSEKLSLTRSAGVATFGLLFLSGVPSDNIDRSDGFFLQQTTPALQLGFDLSDYYDVSGVIEAPFPMDLASAMNRLYLYINLQSSQDLSAIERGAGRRWPFAIIYLDAATNGYKYLNKETFNSITYSLPQPISRLQNLEIEFRDEWYRLVNFNGKDFTLLLEFTTLE